MPLQLPPTPASMFSPAPTSNDTLLENPAFNHFAFSIFCALVGGVITCCTAGFWFTYCVNKQDDKCCGVVTGGVGFGIAAVLSVYTGVQIINGDYGKDNQDIDLATGILYSATIAALYCCIIPLVSAMPGWCIDEYADEGTYVSQPPAPMLPSFTKAKNTKQPANEPRLEITNIEESNPQKPTLVAQV